MSLEILEKLPVLHGEAARYRVPAWVRAHALMFASSSLAEEGPSSSAMLGLWCWLCQ